MNTSVRHRRAFSLAICVALMSSFLGLAQASDREAQTLITNVHVFDGFNRDRIENANVLIEGNPLENLDLVADPHENFDLIMKDGKIFKNTLGELGGRSA